MINRVINKVKRSIIHSKYTVGLSQQRINPGKFGKHIIMYHGVDLVENKKFNQRFIGVHNFKKQLIYLKKNANLISMTDFFEKKFDATKNNIAITFDDGFLNNYTYAVPLLEELKIPATIYVTALNLTNHKMLWPDFVDLYTPRIDEDVLIDNELFRKKNGRFVSLTTNKSLSQIIKERGDFYYKQLVFDSFEKILGSNLILDKRLDDYWRLMTDEQLQEVDRTKYVKIESHSFLHNNLGNIPLDKAVEELEVSKKYLENLLQREVNHLAYPDGSYSRELIDKAFGIGYRYQVAAEGYLFPELDAQDSRILDRMGFYPSDSWAIQLDNLFKRD
jgi:peptidoglycan/xylan/chitin deacetylase (PgdA/CDA1 family)